MDIPEKIWHLMARALNDEASASDREELMKILRHDESLQQQFDLLTRIWEEKNKSIEDQDTNEMRNTITRIINKAEQEDRNIAITPAKRIGKRRTWLVAASFLLIASLGGWFLINSSKNDKKKEAIATQKGSRIKFLLPDGTTVWLNGDSKLYYDKDFSGATREVRLEGEAFFDVVKQSGSSFIVHTSGIDIKVLGTAFNVKSYPEDKTVETTLYRGIVQVIREDDRGQTFIQLKPNEKLILSRQAANSPINLPVESNPAPTGALSASYTIAHIDSTKKESERLETAWLYSRLEFRGDNFEELAKKMERWYDVTIVFTDEKVKQLTVDGSFENETVEQAFAALKAGFPINYKIINHEISVGSLR